MLVRRCWHADCLVMVELDTDGVTFSSAFGIPILYLRMSVLLVYWDVVGITRVVSQSPWTIR